MIDFKSKLIDRVQDVSVILTDVDGVLTDGTLLFDENQNEYKRFNTKDGLMMSLLQKMGYEVGVVTGRESEIVARRCAELGIRWCFQGVKNKREVFEQVRAQHYIESHYLAYIGDDWNDLPLLERAGLKVAPADAVEEVRKRANYITQAKGGEGVFREVGELILRYQGKLQQAIDLFAKPQENPNAPDKQ
jgi:3-deoxy-D-manno-octulosonate 8-phosphate phosphatase (KDO 8-P phosphatase)